MTEGHAVVTGGSSGIGAAVVQRLLDRGMEVTVLDLTTPVEVDHRVGYRSIDVTDRRAVDNAIEQASAERGLIRSAVTCHGIRGSFVPALELDEELVRRVFDVHVVGTLLVANAVVRKLRAANQGGSIVTISSTTAYGGWRQQSDYGVAKAAIRQLTENLAIEWAEFGVRVNSVAPGHTLTPMVQDMIDNGYDVAATETRIPLGRLAEPDEIARAIEHLALDASYTTGVCMPVDGGWTAVGK
ncbi:SDR family NAD(P)-dependent oxidoreductase [Rhodococcus sp. IEGM1428]|uniref:SDR family NAD(P)-dependent oxidoreductase n=1 Tax=Rhodococcus sp. IEGM1428 TaxID=3392191 RepID=UPI003D09D4B4